MPGTPTTNRPNALSTSGGRLMIIWLISLYPLSIVFGASAVVDFIDPYAFGRAALASVFVGCLGEYALRPIIREPTTRLQTLGFAVLVGGTFSIVTNTLRLNGYAVTTQTGWWAAAFAFSAALVGAIVARPWRAGPRDLSALFVLATLMVVSNASRGVIRWFEDTPSRWIHAAEALRNDALQSQRDLGAPQRDVYFILLDGMGRQDILKEMYNVDLTPAVDALKREGFFIPRAARSNYPYTVLSLSSMLNLNYLDSVSDAAGADNPSRAPLQYLIQNNALMSLAKRAGYSVVAYGADVSPFKHFSEADDCECAQFGPSMLEQSTLSKTPLAAIPMNFLTYGAHRARAEATLDGLESGHPSKQRQFTYAHVLLPHPPFVFNADGTSRQPARAFMFNDGDDFPGPRTEYISGYGQQAAFVLTRIVSVVTAILHRPGPKPVIVIQADHGPGSEMKQNDAALTNMDERLSVFAAYYFPDGEPQLYESITPVNAMRLVANRYFGTQLKLTRDESFYATQWRPYTFVRAFADGTESERR
jgi:hypothetical protein